MGSGTPVSGLPVTSGRILNFPCALVAAGDPSPVITTSAKGGKVAIKPPANTCSYTPSGALPPEGTATLKAAPAKGYVFDSWSGDCSGKTCVIALYATEQATVNAAFVPALTVIKKGKGTVQHMPRCGVKAHHCVKPLSGGKVKLVAKPARGWHFVHWGGACRGTHSVCVLKGKKAKRPERVVAVFKK